MQARGLTAAQRDHIARIIEAAVRAVDPGEAIRQHVHVVGDTLHIGAARYPLGELGRILVVGGGKAGTPMAAALYALLRSRIVGGVVNVKHGYTAGAGGWQVSFGARPSPRPAPAPAETGPIQIVEAGHPTPDAAGQHGAERIAECLQGLSERDLVIVLISGGGSALLPLPAPGITLADYQELTGLLLGCGADITAINTVRKHCSGLQGGQLARLAAPAQVAALILSDVVGTPLDAIASGPTVPDHSTFAGAWDVLLHHDIAGRVPASVRAHLQRGLAGEISDTPKPGDPLFNRVHNTVIGDNFSAGRAAVAEARRLGFESMLLTTFIQGEAREVGRVMAGLAQGIARGHSDIPMPACLVCGGETTVTLRGRGLGGRNQELALAAAIALGSHSLPPGVQAAVVSLGTDGADGPTDAAGALATADLLEQNLASLGEMPSLRHDARSALAENNSYPFLAALGDLIFTGPTQTNVNDLILICCWPAGSA